MGSMVSLTAVNGFCGINFDKAVVIGGRAGYDKINSDSDWSQYDEGWAHRGKGTITYFSLQNGLVDRHLFDGRPNHDRKWFRNVSR